MKKFTYLATMLLVMAGAVSCEKKSDVKNPESKLQPTGVMREVSVAAGQGSAKTSVNNGALTWSEGDKLYVAPTAGGIDAAALNITDGVGTASGMFHGRVDSTIADDTQLYGWAGGAWTYNDGAFTVNMPATQTYIDNGLAENAYPSIGTGTIKGGVSLQNPFGVLSLNVKGKDTDAVKSITVTSSANNLAGAFTINPSTLAVSGGSSKTITLTFTEAVSLTSDGVRFYMVIPAAEYPAGDLNVTVTKTDDTTIETSLGAITVAAGNATAKQDVEDAPATTGEAERTGGVMVKWVQLWKDGPKFAEYNVGATTTMGKDSYGGYYAWGGSQSMVDDHYTGKVSLSGDSDTATKLWGPNWQMPTRKDFENLNSNCDVVWITNKDESEYGVTGTLVTGRGGYSGNSVFFPAAGYTYGGWSFVMGEGNNVYLWSSTYYRDDYAFCLVCYSPTNYHEVKEQSYGSEHLSSVRAVLAE
ncbi:MAG: hypothetical protein MJ009_03785 [Paludibacteraceae bacterium]|nr:hypothetical protein [Paludibacteraceae bacterium]